MKQTQGNKKVFGAEAKSSLAGQSGNSFSSIFQGPVLMALLALAIVCFAQPGYSQGTLAPLYTFTNGDGSIGPYQSGQLLEVGQTYTITATPDAGYQFSSWQPVNVFIFTQTNYDQFGNPVLPPVQSIDPSVVSSNIYGAVLEFTLQDVDEITPQGSDPSGVQAFGWQADFVPVPEPANLVMVGCGFAVVAVVWRWRRCSQKLNAPDSKFGI